MKRRILLVFLLMGVTFIGIITSNAVAASRINCPYDIASLSITYGYLDSNSKRLFDDMYNTIREGGSTVDVPEGMTMEDVFEVKNLIAQEASELIAFDSNSTTVSYTEYNGRKIPKTVNISYCCSISEQERYISKLSSMGAKYKGMGERAGILAIHDYVCGVITYDKAASDSGNVANRQRFYDSLSNGMGVCNAYAQGMTALCHFSGFKCSYLSGIASNKIGGGHAWNIAKIGDKYTYIDATWDDSDDSEVCVDVFFGIGFDRLYKNRRNDADIKVFSRLPLGEELDNVIDSMSELNRYLNSASVVKTSELVLEFTPPMYSSVMSGVNPLYNTLAKHGVESSQYTNYDEAYSVIFKNCKYSDAYSFSLSGGKIQISGMGNSTPRSFLLVTDKSTMGYCLSDDWREFNNALALMGLMPNNRSMTYYSDSYYCVISNASWQSVTTFGSEAELKSILRQAKNNRVKSLTIVGELSYYDTVMANNCSGFSRILSDVGVNGSYSYYDSGVITLSNLSF